MINRFSTAGAETSLRELVAATSREVDHGIAVLHADRNLLEVPGLEEVDFFVPPGVKSGYVANVRHVLRAIRQFEPDLVHSTLFEANTAARVAGRVARVPVLVSLVNTPYVPAALVDRSLPTWKHRVVRHVDRALSRYLTTRFHAITEAVADAYVEDFGLDRAAISVVPRGRSLERLGARSASRRSRVRRSLGLSDGEVFILAVGRQEAQKGHRYLLEAAPAILRERPDVRILVAGRAGAASPALSDRHEQLGLGDRFQFLGFRDDVPDLLTGADVFVFPSLYEGLGGAALEAMALEVPIVASDVPALREVLDEGRAGVLVPPGDAAQLADACLQVIASPELGKALSAAGRTRFETEYSLDAVAREMVELYRRVVTG